VQICNKIKYTDFRVWGLSEIYY